jgi:hypothetical protein
MNLGAGRVFVGGLLAVQADDQQPSSADADVLDRLVRVLLER